jgi:hypothetical protein
MHLFEIITTGEQPLPVFARSYDEAVLIYLLHRVKQLDIELPDLEVRQRNPSWQGLDSQLLDEALKAESAGVGSFEVGYGWMITSPSLPYDRQATSC